MGSSKRVSSSPNRSDLPDGRVQLRLDRVAGRVQLRLDRVAGSDGLCNIAARTEPFPPVGDKAARTEPGPPVGDKVARTEPGPPVFLPSRSLT